MSGRVRTPAVAGLFYPAEPEGLAATVDDLLATAHRATAVPRMRSSSRTRGTPTPDRSLPSRTARWSHGLRRSTRPCSSGRRTTSRSRVQPSPPPTPGRHRSGSSRWRDELRVAALRAGRTPPTCPTRPSTPSRSSCRSSSGCCSRVHGAAGRRRRHADGRRRRPRRTLSGAEATRSSSCPPTSATTSTTQRRASSTGRPRRRSPACARRGSRTRGLRLARAARPRRARPQGRPHDRAPRTRHLGRHGRRPLPGGRLRRVRSDRVERSPAPRDMPGDTGT